METLPSPFTPEPSRLQPKSWFDRYQYYILGGLVLGLMIGIYFSLLPDPSLANGATSIATDEVSVAGDTSATPSTSTGQIVVDIAGAVANPGVYYLGASSIVEDAIQAAGGFSRLADIDEIARTVNRAGLVEAHSKIYIPKKGDRPVVYTEPPTTNSPANSSPSLAGTKVNINTATATELDILPGVGPITAQRIIDYRIQQGNFSNIEGIQNVPGIGQAKFDQLKDLITI